MKRAYVGGTLAANPLSAFAGYCAIKEIAATDACAKAGRAGDRLADGLQLLVEKYALPYVVYNQGSIVHLECTGAMSYDFSSLSLLKSLVGILKKKPEIMLRKEAMEHMGAAYMSKGIVTLAGSRLYTSLADTDEVIDEALNKFEDVFKMVEGVKPVRVILEENKAEEEAKKAAKKEAKKANRAKWAEEAAHKAAEGAKNYAVLKGKIEAMRK